MTTRFSTHLTLRAYLMVTILLVMHIPMTMGQTNERGLSVKTVERFGHLPGQAKRFALIIGVDDYEDPQINKLEAASNDAKTLADALVMYAGFPRDQVIVLTTDQQAVQRPTRGNILRRLANLQVNLPADGLLLIAFSGHGIERGGKAYLLPYDAQLNDNVKLLEETAISVDVVQDWVRQIGVKQVLMILDACRNDPENGKGEKDNTLSQAFDFDLRNQGVEAFAKLYATEIGYRAYENKEIKQGYFTWALVEGLKGKAANEKGEVTLAALIRYLQEVVPRQISLDIGTNNKQRPFAIVEGYKADELVIAVGSGAAERAYEEGLQLKMLGDRESRSKALARFEEASGKAEGDRRMLSKIYKSIGETYFLMEENQKAISYYSRALVLTKAEDDKDAEAKIHHGLGMAYSSLGEIQKALASYEDSLRLRRLIGDKPGTAKTLSNVGDVYSTSGNHQTAIAKYMEALSLYEVVGDRDGQSKVLYSIGVAFMSLGKREKAKEYFQRAQLLKGNPR